MSDRTDEQGQVLAVNQQTAAGMLGVSVSTLRRWARDGRGPTPIRVSRLVRYRPEELDRFLRGLETPAR
jgi:predicted site-specific integrase-resolvase